MRTLIKKDRQTERRTGRTKDRKKTHTNTHTHTHNRKMQGTKKQNISRKKENEEKT